ncbi:MAG: right-handed parallel beta-helix repeat-containing protein, partial [Deltaproteobacteria bacterium]|nr:right-handed parallel beta-helix repeat-containing protein [Deltaproteobacteria bacterium]
MKKRCILPIILMIAMTIACLSETARAGIPEPDVTYYGIARYRGVELTDQEVTLVLNENSVQIAAFTPGSNPVYGDYYVMNVEMDVLNSIAGKAAAIYINGEPAAQTTIPAAGTVVYLDLDTLQEDDDSDNDDMADSWEITHFGDLSRDGTGDLNEDGTTDLNEYLLGSDPAAPVWVEIDQTHRVTCVPHPLVLHKALAEAQADGLHNRINLKTGTYAGNFSYTAASGEDADLEIVGGYGQDCIDRDEDPALTMLDGDADGDGDGDGPVLLLDTATGASTGMVRLQGLYIKNGVNPTETGGGIRVSSDGGAVEILGTRVMESSALKGGGIAIATNTGSITLLNNILADNIAAQNGGGLSLEIADVAQTVLVANNTIDGNTGGGVYCSSAAAAAVIQNNIVTNSLAGRGIVLEGDADFVIDYNNVWNNEDGNYSDTTLRGDHDTSFDPLFADAEGSNYRLSTYSPCIDEGLNSTDLPDADHEGTVRVLDGNSDSLFLVDMGAYESDGAVPPETCDYLQDADCDDVADASDLCPGFDDALDADDDLVPDGCDLNPGLDDFADDDEDGMPYGWEIAQDGLDPSTPDGDGDLDGDYFTNLQEYLAVTDPNDPESVPPNQVPGVPVLSQPPDQSEIASLRPVLEVINASDDDLLPPAYDFELYAAQDMTTPVLSATGLVEGTAGTTSWQIDADLDENTHYRWRVRANDNAENPGSWSDLFTFFVNTANDVPAIPSVNTPQDGDEVNTLEPALGINNAADIDLDALTYLFEIDTVAGFNSLELQQSPAVNQGAGNTTSWSPVALDDNTVYFWRVRACDDDSCSEWMQTAGIFINTVNDLPSIPDISSPPDESQVSTLHPILEITNASDPDLDSVTYEFEVYADEYMNTLITSMANVFQGENGTTSWQVDVSLQDTTTYWWRAQSRDSENEASGWSELFTFTAYRENDAPTSPLIISPQEAEEVASIDPALVVNNSTDANLDTLSYFIEIDRVNTFNSYSLQQSPELQEGVGDTLSWRPSTLNDNTTYYWRVIAYDGAAYSSWASGSFFTNVANDSPSMPIIQNPAEGSLLTESLPTLSVVPSIDMDLDQITYEYELYTSTDPASYLTTAVGEGASWQVDVNLADNIMYYWRARAMDEHGLASDWSSLTSFSVNAVNDRPTAPTLNNPLSGGIATSLFPTLSVNNSTDPDNGFLSYLFELFADPALTDTVDTADIPQGDLITAWTPPTGLSDGAIYYWRARASDGEQISGWMATAVFKVNTGGAATEVEVEYTMEVSAVSVVEQVIEITNTESRLMGVSVAIPPGAITEDCTITIGLVTNPPALPEYTKAIGLVTEFGPAGTTFAIPVSIKIPYTQDDLDNAEVDDPAELEVWTYNTSTLTWEEIPVARVDETNMRLICEVDHFSMYITGKSIAPPPSAPVSGGGGGGCFITAAEDEAYNG